MARQREYVERLALFYEGAGLARMAGRILGWLLICDPPGQTAGDLERALQASKGSISTNLRLLTTARLIERYAPPGARRDHYRLAEGAWSDTIRERSGQVRVFRDALAEGLDLLTGTSPERRERLQDSFDLYDWLDDEMPALWQRWDAERARRRARRREHPDDHPPTGSDDHH